MLCKHAACARRGSPHGRARRAARHPGRGARRQAGGDARSRRDAWTSPARSTFRRTAICRRTASWRRCRHQVEAAGVEFAWNTEVTRLARRGGTGRSAPRQRCGGEIEADEFVLCGGSWSPALARELGLRSADAGRAKATASRCRTPRQLPAICAILTEARVAVTPMGAALRFGGTMEIAGLNEDINPVRVRGIIAAVPKLLSRVQPADFDGVAAMARPASLLAGRPAVSRPHREVRQPRPIATGHAMMGVSLGPITGKLIAGMLCRRDSADRPDAALRGPLLTPRRLPRLRLLRPATCCRTCSAPSTR